MEKNVNIESTTSVKDLNETDKTLKVARATLETLKDTKLTLGGSSSGLGFMEMFAGGLITTLMNQRKMNRTEKAMKEACEALAELTAALHEMEAPLELSFDPEEFSAFKKYFDEDFVYDYLMQNRLENTKENLSLEIEKVREIISKLKERKVQEESTPQE